MDAAATKIQARFRGRGARSEVQAINAEREKEREELAMQLGATSVRTTVPFFVCPEPVLASVLSSFVLSLSWQACFLRLFLECSFCGRS
jgi:hypothetical protein